MIHTEYDGTLITRTLNALQQPGINVQGGSEDLWIAFFREMCQIARINFTPIVQHLRPLPLNVSVSLRKLPDAKFVCNK